MGLDWDILLDDVSVKDQISRFEVRDSAGGYARELTLDAADPSFYDQFTYTVLPQLRLEVKVTTGGDWVSLGKFYVEQPGISAGPDVIAVEGLWGRSETAKAGAPFAPKVSKSWEADTTAGAIINEMAALVDLTVDLQMTDYTVFAGSYSVDGVYPIDVIAELAEYAGGSVGCTAGGVLVVRSTVFHPAAADHIVTDLEIAGITENVAYPEFGNRIKISADGSDSGLSVSMAAPDNADCLPADGTSKSKLYAFVSNNDGPVDDGIVVTWTAEAGVTLARASSSTGPLLISNKIHNADNYYTVTVDYPVQSVVGIWAYSDRRHTNNFWNTLGSFEDNEITVYRPFAYCDQTLVVTYITAGCAVNTVTAGTEARDVTVTADVNGNQGTIDVKLGNTCACGSSLNAVKSTDTDICFGNSAPILLWAEINGGPATGMIATLTLTGCGELSSTKKILGSVKVVNEIGYAVNEIAGTSQVETAAYPDDSVTPAVYLTTDTGKSNNLYQSHDGKLIDLDTEVETGTEVWIDYTADGAAAVSWLTDGITAECDAEILIKMADGTEGGLSETVSLSAVDCTDDESADDATTSDYSSEDDPDEFDNDGSDGGEFDKRLEGGESGGVVLDACDVMILNRITNIDNATAENKDDIRFGVSSATDCSQDDPYGCPCSELCASEVRVKGNTYDYNKTIHETVVEAYDEGTPEYYEAYGALKAAVLAECEEKCEAARAIACEECPGGDLEVDEETTPDTIAPSSSATIYFDGGAPPYSITISGSGFWLDDGFSVTSLADQASGDVVIYADGDACGVATITISDGCSHASYDIACTEGSWILREGTSLDDCAAAGGEVTTDSSSVTRMTNTEKIVIEYDTFCQCRLYHTTCCGLEEGNCEGLEAFCTEQGANISAFCGIDYSLCSECAYYPLGGDPKTVYKCNEPISKEIYDWGCA